MAFKPKDLKYKNYTKHVDKGDNPEYVGKLDRIKLDRDEEYEVICFANAYAKEHLFFPDIDDLHHIEDMLKNTVPSNMVMKDEIAEFLKENW